MLPMETPEQKKLRQMRPPIPTAEVMPIPTLTQTLMPEPGRLPTQIAQRVLEAVPGALAISEPMRQRMAKQAVKGVSLVGTLSEVYTENVLQGLEGKTETPLSRAAFGQVDSRQAIEESVAAHRQRPLPVQIVTQMMFDPTAVAGPVVGAARGVRATRALAPVLAPAARALAVEEVGAVRFSLPANLKGAKPKYAIGQQRFTLEWESELDKALYILAQTKKSPHDAEFLEQVMRQTGMTEIEARAAGRQVKTALKPLAQQAEGGFFTVPRMFEPAAAIEKAIPTRAAAIAAPRVVPIPDEKIIRSIEGPREMAPVVTPPPVEALHQVVKKPVVITRRPAAPESPLPDVEVTEAIDGSMEVKPPVPDEVANVLGVRPIPVKLSRAAEHRNFVRRQIERLGWGYKPVFEVDLVESAFKEKKLMKERGDSQANRIAEKEGAALRTAFKIDHKTGVIDELAGVDVLTPNPTIADIAARLPVYAKHLSSEQLQAMLALKRELEPYAVWYRTVGKGTPQRADIMEGGFYVPRGRAGLEGVDEPIKVVAPRGPVGGKRAFERAAVFASQSEGIAAGYQYAPIEDALQTYVKDISGKITDAHIANFFKTYTDETGQLIGETPKMRMLRRFPELAKQMGDLRGNLARLKALGGRLDDKQDAVVDRFLLDPEYDNVDALREALVIPVKTAFPGAKVSPNVGAKIGEIEALQREMRKQIKALQPAWNQAKRAVAQIGREEGAIGLPNLEGWSFPNEIANSANAILRGMGAPVGAGAFLVNVTTALNTMYRSFRSTFDNSGVLIQGLIGLGNDPKAYREALKVNLRAWFDGRAIGTFLGDFDNAAARNPSTMISSEEWATSGLRIGGQEHEMMVEGLGARIKNLPGVRQSNRAYGFFGDALRLSWAQDELALLLNKGRTLAEIRASGDLQHIADAVNKATGYSATKAFGNLGDMLLFAPRFLQSRLETVAKAVKGVVSGRLDEKIATTAMLKTIAYAVGLTTVANAVQGRETDWRPVIKRDGRWVKNPNFMAVRFLGRDYKFLGTWDSLAGNIINLGTGRPDIAFRNLGSGLVANIWDFSTGRTAVGERTRDTVGQTIERLFENFIPFFGSDVPAAARAILETPPEEKLERAVGELIGTELSFFGGKSAILSVGDVTQNAIDDAIRTGKLAGFTDPQGQPWKVGTEYGELQAGARRIIEADPRVEKARKKALPREAIGGKEAVTRAIATWDTEKARMETELRAKIDAGMKGKDLRDAIQEFKRERAIISKTTFDPQVEAALRRNGDRSLWDVMGDRFWNVEPEVNLATGDVNFKKLETDRRAILDEAVALGIPAAYITGSGVQSFRGQRFTDPRVLRIVNAYERDIKLLKPFWDSTNNEGRDVLAEDDQAVWDEYITAAPVKQKALKAANPVIKMAEQARERAREIARQENPTIDAALIRWGYSTTAYTDEGQAILDILAQ